LFLPAIIPKCTHVIENPDNKRIAVFNIGIPHGFNTTIFIGGHTNPNNMDGDKLE
jgi:hypothetical protein